MSDNPLDFSSYTPEWANSGLTDQDGPERIIARIEAETGHRMSEAEKRQVAIDLVNGGKFDIAAEKVNPLDFSEYTPDWATEAPASEQKAASLPVLPSSAPVAPKEEGGYWSDRMSEMGDQVHELSQFGETLYGGGQRLAANMAEQTPRVVKGIIESMLQSGSQAVSRGHGDVLHAAQQADEAYDPLIDAMPEATIPLRQAAKGHAQAGEELRKAIQGRDWLTRELGGGLIDAANSPSSAVSLVGGPLATIGIADQYGQSYSDARTAGLSKEDAEVFAWSQAAPEAISFIPAGKILERTPGIGPLLKSRVRSVEEGLVKKIASPNIKAAIDIAKTASGEAVEEGFTGGIQDIAAAAMAGQDHAKELKKFAAGQAPLDEKGDIDWNKFASNRYRDMRAGAIMGVGGGVVEGRNAYKEFDNEVEDRTNKITNTVLGNSDKEVLPVTARRGEQNKQEDEVTLDIKREQDRIDQEKAKEDAFKQAEQEREKQAAAETRQKEIEQEAGFRTIAAEASVKGKTRLDKYGPGNAEVVPINPPAEVTPEAVQAEREQAEKAEAARLERVEMGQWAERVRSRQAKLAAAAKSEQTKAEKKAKTAEEQRQRDITDKLIADNPGKDPAELAPLLKAAVEAPVEAKPNSATPVAAAPAPKRTDKQLAGRDKEIASFADQLGLNLETEEAGAAPVTAEHRQKVRDIVKGLVSKNTQDTVDVQNLLLQGKLQIVPSAKAAGLNVSENAKASYNTGSGKMYLFADKLNGNDTAGAMMAALHESTHAGQYNDRSGRTSLMSQIMGKGENDVKKLILNANGKNAIATKAIEKAAAAAGRSAARRPAETREEWYNRIHDLELVPYFVTEAVRAKSVGGLGSAVRSIKGAAKQYLRENMGVDLDVTLDDVAHAVNQTAGEIVKTDVKGNKKRSENLEMVGGEKATGWKEAVEDGATYRGRVDQKNRFEFSDEGASIDQRQLAKLNNLPYLPLGDVLHHPELYKQYPGLDKKIKVRVDDTLKGRNEGYVDGNTINLNKNYVNGGRTTDDLMETLLHEVQHNIQSIEGFVPGSSTRYFLPKQVMNVRNMAERNYQRSLRRFDLEKAIANMPASGRNAWLASEAKRTGWDSVEGDNLTKDEATKERFIQNGYVEFVKNDDVKDQADNYYKALGEFQKAKEDFEKANDVAYATYQADYGEAEARTTAARKNLTKEMRRAIPLERDMRRTGVPVENTIDSTKYIRMDEDITPASENLESADEAPKLPMSRKMHPIISGLFSSAAGTGPRIREIMEHAASSPAAERMIAEGTVGKYRTGIDKLAALRGMTPEALNKEIQQKLDAIDKRSDSFQENLDNFISVAKQYGEAGEALIAFRNQADELSMQMIKDRIERKNNGEPLTEDEKDVYGTIANNLGRYAHRQFATHMGTGGKKYAETIWKDYEAYKKANGNNVSEKVKNNYERVANAVQKIVDERLMIPDDEALAEMNAEDTRRLYSEWSTKTNNDVVPLDQMKEELADMRDKVNENEKVLNKQAERIAQQILGVSAPTSLTAKYFLGGKIDKSILKERKMIPEEIRELMGEIKDPAMRLFATVAKQTEFLARNKMLLELRNLNEPAHIQPPGPAGREAVKGMEKLEGDKYGPLENHYVSKNLYSMLNSNIQMLANFEQSVAMAAAGKSDAAAVKVIHTAIKGWGRVASISKMMQIILNPANFYYNFGGGLRTLLVNGNLNPKSIAKGYLTAMDIIRYATNPASNTPEARRVTSAGVTDSAFVGEINSELYAELNKVVKQMQGKSSSKAKEMFDKVFLSGKEAYAMMDVTYKLANFYHQADVVLPAYYKAAGIEKSQKEIDREAADIVNDTNVTYKRAAPVVRGIEKYGVTQFGTFFYEVFRTEVNNIKQGLKELKRAKDAPTPEAAAIMAKQGAARLSGHTIAMALTLGAARFMAHAAFGNDEDEEHKKRALLPDYLQNQDFISMGKDEKGDEALFNMSRFDPAGPLTDIMRSAVNTDADLDKLASNLFQLYVAPRIGTRIVEAAATIGGLEKKSPPDPLVQELAPKTYEEVLNALYALGVPDKNTKVTTRVGEAFLPGVAGSFNKNNVHPEPKGLVSGLGDFLSYTGARLYKVNSESQLKSKAYEHKDLLQSNARAIADSFKDHPSMDAQTLTGRLADMRIEERQSFDKLKEVYEGMKAVGKTPRQVNARLKDMGLSQPVIHDLRTGEFHFRSLNSNSVKTYENNELKGKSRAERKAIREKWKTARGLLRISKEELDNEEQE